MEKGVHLTFRQSSRRCVGIAGVILAVSFYTVHSVREISHLRKKREKKRRQRQPKPFQSIQLALVVLCESLLISFYPIFFFLEGEKKQNNNNKRKDRKKERN